MISLRRIKQGGSVLTFIIIAAVLALGVIGTAYFVKQRGEQVRTQQAIEQADKLTKTEDSSEQTPTTPSSDGDTATDTTNTPAETTPGVTAPVATEPTESSPSVAAQDQAVLPTTGPESVIGAMLAVGLLVASSSAYIVSRRTLDRSL